MSETTLTRKVSVGIGVFGLLIIMVGVILHAGWMYSPLRQTYKDNIHEPYCRQYWAETPEDYVDAGKALLEGIYKCGLVETDYVRIFPWNKHNVNAVGFYITYIESTIARGEDTITWKEDLYTNKTVSEITNDVYEKKMDELRSNVGNIGTSSNLQKALLVKHQPVWLFTSTIVAIGIIFSIIGMVIFFS